MCPTDTPATSVIAFFGPGSNTPGVRPMSRARGLASLCASVVTTERAPNAAIEAHFISGRMIRFSGRMRQISIDAITDAAQHVYKAAVRTPLIKLDLPFAAGGAPEVYL